MTTGGQMETFEAYRGKLGHSEAPPQKSIKERLEIAESILGAIKVAVDDCVSSDVLSYPKAIGAISSHLWCYDNGIKIELELLTGGVPK